MLAPAQLIEHLTDAFEQGNEELPGTASATLVLPGTTDANGLGDSYRIEKPGGIVM